MCRTYSTVHSVQYIQPSLNYEKPTILLRFANRRLAKFEIPRVDVSWIDVPWLSVSWVDVQCVNVSWVAVSAPPPLIFAPISPALQSKCKHFNTKRKWGRKKLMVFHELLQRERGRERERNASAEGGVKDMCNGSRVKA